MRRHAIPCALVLSWLLPAACGGAGSPAPYPSAPIELVVPFIAGGGSDNLARMIQAIVAEERLVPQPVNVVNRPGGAGALGLAYVASKPADPHTLMTAIDTVLAVPLQAGYRGPTVRDLSIVAILALDPMLVVVPGSSPIGTMGELVARAREAPGGLKLATNAAGGEDHIFGGMIEHATGARFTYVHTKGGAEAMQNVMGGHVDVATPNPNEAISQAQGGLVRILAVSSRDRLAILPEVPTLRESGIDVEYQMFRGIAMPAGVAPEVLGYWSDVLAKVTATGRWKRDYLDRLALAPAFKSGAEAAAFVAETETALRGSLKTLGLVD